MAAGEEVSGMEAEPSKPQSSDPSTDLCLHQAEKCEAAGLSRIAAIWRSKAEALSTASPTATVEKAKKLYVASSRLQLQITWTISSIFVHGKRY